MIEPAAYDISIQRGATFNRTFQLKDGTGAALNMSGWTVKAQIWQAEKRSQLASFVVTWVNQASGQFTISLDATTTSNLGQDGYWDLLVDTGSSKDYWLRGAVTMVEGYTE